VIVPAIDHLAYSRWVSAVTGESIQAATRDVARALLPDLPSIGDGTAAYIESAMPEEVAQPEVRELLRASCHANSSALLDGLMRGVSLDATAPSAEVIQTTRALVRYGLGLSDIVRGYQVGATYWCRRWAEAVELYCDASLAVPTVSHGTTFVLGWLERVIDRLTAEYRDEAERLAREASFARAADVRRALTDPELDVDTISRRLAYDLRGRHVAFVLSSHREGDEAPLEVIAHEVAGALTTARPLVVRVELDHAWCWVPASEPRVLGAPHADVLVGQGRPASGLEGFRRSHREACEALRVAVLAGHTAGTITRYEEIELAALCSGDPGACRAFVAAELGPLAADTSESRRLRSTLEAFFDANSNFRATAARLSIHHNTVRYRLDQAETVLERPIGERRLHLELALHLAARLGAGER
jgi:GGDEF-like domain/PucR C-terminal helix-turn-helix domain